MIDTFSPPGHLPSRLPKLTALAWSIAALQDTDDPRTRDKEQSFSRIKRGLCFALVGALELLSAADYNIQIFLPKFWIQISESRH
jgi:hypothetical protein